MCQLRQSDQVGGNSMGQQHESKKENFEAFNQTLGLERINEGPRVRL